jgi:hypothetical protein
MLGVDSTVDVHLIYSVGVCTSNLDEEVINVEKEDYNRKSECSNISSCTDKKDNYYFYV